MTIRFKTFDALTTAELYALLKLRFDIFVLEQRCFYPELDGKDAEALHCLAESGGALGGTLRIFTGPEGAVIGRVAIAPGERGAGLGGAMMRAAIARIGPMPIRLASQAYLRKWYEGFGFTAVSAEYDDDGIPHIDMARSAP